MFIKEVRPKTIKDSRGEKTIEIQLKTYKGSFSASAPSGKSKGANEVDSYNDRGFGRSMKLIRAFSKRIEKKNFMIKDFGGLKLLTKEVERFEHRYGKLGGNVHYALEIVFLKGAAAERGKELWQFVFDSFDFFERRRKPKMPRPVGNCIGGGMHSKKMAGKKPDFQEFLLIPKKKRFSRNVTTMYYAYERAKKLLKKYQKSWVVKRNDEGAWRTSLTNEQVLDIMKKLKKRYHVDIGLDVAASSFFSRRYYHYENKKLIRDRVDQIDYIEKLTSKYGLLYVEDPLDEEDFSGFVNLKKKFPERSMVVSDDLTTTNLSRLRRANRNKGIDALIVKPNQIGSLEEVARVVKFCKENDLKIVFSHRSGETMDDSLADLAVGFQADFLKCGIYGRERLVKLRRVMEIERSL